MSEGQESGPSQPVQPDRAPNYSRLYGEHNRLVIAMTKRLRGGAQGDESAGDKEEPYDLSEVLRYLADPHEREANQLSDRNAMKAQIFAEWLASKGIPLPKYTKQQAQDEAVILQEKVDFGHAATYEEAEHQLENENPDGSLRPITERMFATPITHLRPITKSRNIDVLKKKDLERIVERPLLAACEELYDKNIITLGSSANKKDAELPDGENAPQLKPGGAYITIDFDTLSKRNQETAERLGKVSLSNQGRIVEIVMPLNRESTFRSVHEWSLGIAHQFVKQPYTPIVHTLEEARQAFDSVDGDPEDLVAAGAGYWAPQERLFFSSEEQYLKAIEEVGDDEKDTTQPERALG